MQTIHKQCGRRLCLRIKSLTKKTKEGANDVLNQVHDLFKEAEVEMPDAVWIGRTELVKKTMMSSFVLKNQSIHLDLTKSRLSLLNEARKLIENNEDIAFCYADINCRCNLRFKNNDEFFFNH